MSAHGGLSQHPDVGPLGGCQSTLKSALEGLSQEDKEESSEEGKSDRQVQERAAPCFSLLENLGTGAGTPTAVCPPSHRDPTTSSVTASAGPDLAETRLAPWPRLPSGRHTSE